MKVLNEVLELHDTLNPKIWDIANDTLLPEVKEKILQVIKLFTDYMNTPIDIVDVQLVGSNASYNYTQYSDLDVHIIANFENISDDINILKMLYDANKTIFNKNFDITIHGVEIELYVQDVKSGIISNGIYSILSDEWIKFPRPIEVKSYDTSREIAKWKIEIENAINSESSEEIKNTINRLYLVRHNSIMAEGEYSKGNQLFKDIRNLGWLDKLKTALNKSLSKELSLESFSKGQLVNRF